MPFEEFLSKVYCERLDQRLEEWNISYSSSIQISLHLSTGGQWREEKGEEKEEKRELGKTFWNALCMVRRGEC